MTPTCSDAEGNCSPGGTYTVPETPPRFQEVAFVSFCVPNVMLSGKAGAGGLEQPDDTTNNIATTVMMGARDMASRVW